LQALPDAEAAYSLRLLFRHFYALDLRAARAFVHEAHESFDRICFAFEDRFDRAVPAIRHRAGEMVLLREAPHGVAEEHALDVPVRDHASPDHGSYSPAVVEFRDILKRRRMVRAFKPDEIPRETLERITSTIRRAPSGGFSQGQRFVVVTDPQLRAAIGEAVGEQYYVRQGFAPWISGAPALVVVCAREEDYHERYRQPDKIDEEGQEIEWPVPYWYVDAGKAAMLVLLAAIDEGLAAGVFGVPAERMTQVRELLRLPRDVAIVEVITLGRAAEDTVSDRLSSRGTRPRKPLDELVRWERWD
jgi:nitroreductase